jgi:hypothetical protein
MDEIKKAIADYVSETVQSRPFHFPDLPVELITYAKVSDLETMIRVKTTVGGTRYFLVAVAEKVM